MSVSQQAPEPWAISKQLQIIELLAVVKADEHLG